MTVTLHHYLILSILLFAIGIVGVAARRNAFVMTASLLLIFDSSCILFLAFSRWNLLLEGKVFALFIIGVKALWFLFGLAVLC